MYLKEYTAPTMEPVTTAQVKSWARITWTDDDTDIARAITAARHEAEKKTGVQCVQATYYLYLDEFPPKTQENPLGAIILPRPPLQSVTGIAYLDGNGTSQTLSASLYSVSLGSDVDRGYIIPAYGQVWPSTYDMPNSVTVVFVTGWPVTLGAATTHDAIKDWIISRVTSKFNYKEQIYAGYNTVQALPRDFVDGVLDRWITAKGI